MTICGTIFLNPHRPAKPCVGGYTIKRPRFEPEEVAPETNRGSTYFPTGDNRRPASVADEGATTTTSSGDSRHPKEVTTDDEDFSIHDIQVYYFIIFKIVVKQLKNIIFLT